MTFVNFKTCVDTIHVGHSLLFIQYVILSLIHNSAICTHCICTLPNYKIIEMNIWIT